MTADTIWHLVREIDPHYSLSPSELKFVLRYAVRVPPHSVMLELGVCHGRTFAALALAAMATDSRVFGIDHFGLEGSGEEVRESLRQRGITNWTLFEANTHDMGWKTPIDLLVVDAGHDVANVKPDIEDYVPHVKPGGYVFFDDYDEPYDPDSPHWAVRHYADLACGNWEPLDTGRYWWQKPFLRNDLPKGMVDGMKGWRRPQ